MQESPGSKSSVQEITGCLEQEWVLYITEDLVIGINADPPLHAVGDITRQMVLCKYILDPNAKVNGISTFGLFLLQM